MRRYGGWGHRHFGPRPFVRPIRPIIRPVVPFSPFGFGGWVFPFSRSYGYGGGFFGPFVIILIIGFLAIISLAFCFLATLMRF